MMKAITINIQEEDADLWLTFREWWRGHGTEAVPIKTLPKCGVLVYDENDQEAAVSWLYMDNSVGCAWMAWMTTRPDLTPIQSVRILEYLVGAVEAVALELNYGLMFTMTDRPGLQRWLSKRGWNPNHTGMTQLFKPIG